MEPQDPNSIFQIGEIAAQVGLSPRTIRYYEEIGLLDGIKRKEGGKRIYTIDNYRRLKFIKKLKLLGLSLAEVHELNALYRTYRKNSRVLPRLIELLNCHLTEIDQRIENMITLRKEIQEYRLRIRHKLNGGAE